MLWDIGQRQRGGHRIGDGGGQEGFAGYWTLSPGYCNREPWKGWERKGSCTEHVDEQLGKSLALSMQQVWKSLGKCLAQKARLCQQLVGAARSFPLVTFFALGIWGDVRIAGCSSRRWRVMEVCKVAGFPSLKSTVTALVRRG